MWHAYMHNTLRTITITVAINGKSFSICSEPILFLPSDFSRMENSKHNKKG